MADHHHKHHGTIDLHLFCSGYYINIVGRKEPLEEGVATHSRILSWRIPWTEEPGGLQSIGLQRQTRLK